MRPTLLKAKQAAGSGGCAKASDQELDNDLMKALSEIPPMKMATIDEAFVVLDSGLGAIFSASMARRAAMTRNARRTSLEGLRAGKKATLLGEDLRDPGGTWAKRESPLNKTRNIFKEATARIIAPLRTQKAQETTLKMLSELSGLQGRPGHQKRAPNALGGGMDSPGGSRRCSFFDAHLKFKQEDLIFEHGKLLHLHKEEEVVQPEHHLPEDPLVRTWAEEHLGVSADRMHGLEESVEFRERLAHQMLCWQTLRADKFDKRSAEPRHESKVVLEPASPHWHHTYSDSEDDDDEYNVHACDVIATGKEPRGFVSAQRSLFGLTHHLDAQQLRRSRGPGSAMPWSQDLELPPVEKAKPSTAPEAEVKPLISKKQAAAATAQQSSTATSFSRSAARPAVRHVVPMQAEVSRTPRNLPTPRRLPSQGQARDAPLGVSLRVPPRFVEPHFEISSADVGHTPELTYLRCCEAAGLVPCPAVWRHFGRGRGIIDASQRSLSDADIQAVMDTAAQLAVERHELRVLDLSQNALTDVGVEYVASFMTLHSMACNKLSSISLSDNSGIRFVAEDALANFSKALSELPALCSLDLSGVPLHGPGACKLFECLDENFSLKSLSLSGCGLGRLDQAECVAAAGLIASRFGGRSGLEAYDLSCNFFSTQGFAAAAEALQSSKLHLLSFAGNCISSKNTCGSKEQLRFHSMQLLLEGMHFNSSLQELNLSSCGMGPDTAFVLEDALIAHPELTSLDLSDNPLGDAGIRCVLRLLLHPKPIITECEIGNHRQSDATAQPLKFRHAQPTGIYNLNLRYPLDRSTLRMLMRICVEASSNPLRFFKFDPKQAKLDVKNVKDRWIVPTQGTFNFSFLPPLSTSALEFSVQAQNNLASDGVLEVPHLSVSELPSMMPSMVPSRSSSPSGGSQSARRSSTGRRRSSNLDSTQPLLLNSKPRSPSFDKGSGVTLATFVVPGNLPGLASPSATPRASFIAGIDLAAPTVVKPNPRSSLKCMADQFSDEQFQQLKDTTSLFESDWGEVTTLMTQARVKVPALAYPLIRRMFLSFITLDQQLRFIHACSKDLAFNGPQVTQLCEDRPELATHTVCALFPSIRGRTPQLLFLNTSPVVVSSSMARDVSQGLWFQEGNVTGKYNLDLEKPCDYAIAENCLISNAWESEVGRVLAWPDISQRGTYEMLRNEAHNEVRFNYTREWMLPSHGWFRFDYSSIRRPPSFVGVMSESAEVTRYLNRNHARASNEAKVRALRAVSVHMYLTAQQFRNLMLCFPVGDMRQEIFCCFHTRVTDVLTLLSPDVFYSSTLLSNKDRVSLLERVGPLHLLNPMHPERVWYKCHLTMYEQRMIINFLVQLSSKEPGGKITGRGTIAYRHGPVPASWALKGVPEVDQTIICCYEAKHPNPIFRRELAHRFCVGQF